MDLSPSFSTPIDVTAQLRAAGCVYAEDEAELMIAQAGSEQELRSMIEQRIEGLPLEHILGWAEFYGNRVIVTSGVFVPRRRSEFLVDQAIHVTQPGNVVVDLCCGSGALGVALSRAVGDIRLYATDIEPVAVACARQNVVPIGGEVFQGDLYQNLPANLRGHIDVILANAPYVPTDSIKLMPAEARLHEPPVTLDGGPDGLDIQRRVIAGSLDWLAPQGKLLIESSERQASGTAAIMSRHGLSARIVHDLEFDATVVVASKPD